jgi:hypothetical protein
MVISHADRTKDDGSFDLHNWPSWRMVEILVFGQSEKGQTRQRSEMISTAGWVEGRPRQIVFAPTPAVTRGAAGAVSQPEEPYQRLGGGYRARLRTAGAVSQPEEPYQLGPMVDGLQVKLRPNAEMWRLGQEISFLLDVQNYGDHTYYFSGHQSDVLVEVDGRWYKYLTTPELESWNRFDKPRFVPGQRRESLPLLLDSRWREVQPESVIGAVQRIQGSAGEYALKWRPGEHVVRVQVLLWPEQDRNSQPVQVYTRPVNIHVIAVPNGMTLVLTAAGLSLLAASWWVAPKANTAAPVRGPLWLSVVVLVLSLSAGVGWGQITLMPTTPSPAVIVPSQSAPAAPAKSTAAPAAAAPAEAKTSPRRVQLSNGAVIELLGVCQNPADDHTWWDADGQSRCPLLPVRIISRADSRKRAAPRLTT